MIFSLTHEEKSRLLFAAREAVTERLENKASSPAEPKGNLAVPCGAFVTLHKKTGELRGCIGVVVGKVPLLETVREMALASAFQDPRFSPVTFSELSSLIFEISVLSPLRKAAAEEIEVSTHGIYLKKGLHSGLLLPQVAAEQKWGREDFLTHGCRKAGLPDDAWRSPDMQIFIFTALVFREDSV